MSERSWNDGFRGSWPSPAPSVEAPRASTARRHRRRPLPVLDPAPALASLRLLASPCSRSASIAAAISRDSPNRCCGVAEHAPSSSPIAASNRYLALSHQPAACLCHCAARRLSGSAAVPFRREALDGPRPRPCRPRRLTTRAVSSLCNRKASLAVASLLSPPFPSFSSTCSAPVHLVYKAKRQPSLQPVFSFSVPV